jgi:chromosome segregation ATPase
MKKWSIIALILWVVPSLMLPVSATAQNAQSELDQVTAEESQYQTKLLEIQEKKRKVKERLDRQAILNKEIDDLKAQLGQNSAQFREAQDLMRKAEGDFQVSEKAMLAEEQKVKPFKDALDRKNVDRKNLETLISNQQTQLKRLEQEISADSKQYARMSSNSSGLVKKMDTEKSNFDREKSRVTGLKKEGEEIQSRIVFKQKELDAQ